MVSLSFQFFPDGFLVSYSELLVRYVISVAALGDIVIACDLSLLLIEF